MARYTEAAPHVPGSGMVKRPLGSLELVAQLRLDGAAAGPLGLLAAYAHAAPPGAVEAADADEGAASEPPPADAPKMSPRELRVIVQRLRRCLRRPWLLCAPWCWALPAVWWAVCFRAAPAHLPWVGLALLVANGALDHARRAERTAGMIYWEDSVGEADMPRGPLAKMRLLGATLGRLQAGLGRLALALERGTNLFNWSDPVVTLAAIGAAAAAAAAASLTLSLVALPVLVFVAGLAPLAALLASEARAGSPPAAAPAEPPPARADEPTGDAPVAASTGRDGGGDAAHERPSALQMLRNVLARVPDGTDVAHQWFIETEQILEEETLAAPTARGSGATEPRTDKKAA
jgi:hypothetical protein